MSLKTHEENVLTKQNRIAEIAGSYPKEALHSLSQHIDLEWLYVAYRRTRRDGAVGIDGQSANEYEKNLKENLEGLLDRFKSGSYRAPAVKRVYIPKGDGSFRSLGIPTFEDKVLQRAVLMVLEPVYEREFHDCSYGFRPKRNAHSALNDLRTGLHGMVGGYVIDLDIRKYFDSIDHQQLRESYQNRIADGVIRRILGKWLKAGVMEEGRLQYQRRGTPQGGVISPLLSNIFLHRILDDWFVKVVKPRMKRSACMVRYADDAVICIKDKNDAKKVFTVLPKRFERFRLTLHPEKTQLINFRRTNKGKKLETFTFLGFTYYWGRSRRGKKIIKWKTSCERLRKSVRKVHLWCKRNRHERVRDQHRMLSLMLKGHYGYYGTKFNISSLGIFYQQTLRSWHRWLGRRSQKGYIPWESFNSLLTRYPLPTPRIVHSLR